MLGPLAAFSHRSYRLDEGVPAANAVDLEEVLSDECAVVVIEWAARLGHIRFRHMFGALRFSGDGESHERFLFTMIFQLHQRHSWS